MAAKDHIEIGRKVEIMIVTYVSFDIEPSRRDDFEAWFYPLVEKTRIQMGCVAYDYLPDPQQAGLGRMVEVWASPEAYRAHHSHPDHIEMLARGSSEFGMKDLRIHSWTEAQGYSLTDRTRTDDSVPGRDLVNKLVAEYQGNRT
jgi:quinol monooxygenase YgiN